jgi:hypothetical protein
MERRTPISEIDTARRQRFTAGTMQSVARHSVAAAATMLRSADAMRELARAALAEARRQLTALRGSRHGR